MLSRLRELAAALASTSRAASSMAAARSSMPGSVMSRLRRMASTWPARGCRTPGSGAGRVGVCVRLPSAGLGAVTGEPAIVPLADLRRCRLSSA